MILENNFYQNNKYMEQFARFCCNIFKNRLDTFWSDQDICLIIQLINLPESEIDQSL